MTPKQTPMASRFITAVSAETSRLRKATSSSTAPSSTTTPMNSGSRLLMVSVKSTWVAEPANVRGQTATADRLGNPPVPQPVQQVLGGLGLRRGGREGLQHSHPSGGAGLCGRHRRHSRRPGDRVGQPLYGRLV